MTTKITTPPDVLARLQAAWQTPVTPQYQPPASYVDRVIDAAGNIRRLDGNSDNPADQAEINRRAIENAMKRSSLRDAALQAVYGSDRPILTPPHEVVKTEGQL
jgi:hypothetical protein